MRSQVRYAFDNISAMGMFSPVHRSLQRRSFEGFASSCLAVSVVLDIWASLGLVGTLYSVLISKRVLVKLLQSKHDSSLLAAVPTRQLPSD